LNMETVRKEQKTIAKQMAEVVDKGTLFVNVVLEEKQR